MKLKEQVDGRAVERAMAALALWRRLVWLAFLVGVALSVSLILLFKPGVGLFAAILLCVWVAPTTFARHRLLSVRCPQCRAGYWNFWPLADHSVCQHCGFPLAP